jgi:deoxycytidylate deaminase
MKTCKQCQRTLSEDEFYARAAKCKNCTKAAVKARYDHLMATDPVWAAKEMDRQMLKERKRRELGKVSKETPEKAKIRLLRRNSKFPHVRKAHVILGNAVRDKRVVKQPCEVCGSTIVQAHHDDYSKPLEVRWLCVPHHNEHHVQERRKALLAKLQSRGAC